jgi:hypothetical protein
MSNQKSATKTKVTYHRFSVVDTRRPKTKSETAVDAATPSLKKLKSIDLKKYGGKVVFKKAVPRATSTDGGASSKRLIVKNGEVIGAQG